MKKLASPKKKVSSPKRASPKKVAQKKKKSVMTNIKGKLNIVLDLDATLLETIFSEDNKNIKYIETKILNNTKIKKSQKDDFMKRFHKIYSNDNFQLEGYTILRPHIFEFLEWCNDFFNSVSIWTAGNKIYAETIVNILFPFQKPDLIFTIEDCIKDSEEINELKDNEDILIHFNKGNENKNTHLRKSPSPSHSLDDDEEIDQLYFSKPLIRVQYKLLQMKNSPESVCMKKKNIKEQSVYLKNIVLIDDRNDTSQFNINNLIQIPVFEIIKLNQKELLKEDKALLKIKDFFENIPDDIEDIRDYLKENKIKF